MLVAIIDCLVSSELDILAKTLQRDGIQCVSSDESLELMHEKMSLYSSQPLVIYGTSSLQVPYDDCPRLWLCCGPEIEYDEQHAAWLLGNDGDASNDDELADHLARREKAIRCGYTLVTYVDALSFMANVLATRCVDSMNLGNKAADIILRHVPKHL